MLQQQSTLNCKGKILDLSQPLVMGILNLTPDSFYDGGKFQSENEILKQTEKMIIDGAAIIDIGGMSTRPGSHTIEVAEEIQRTLPAIKAITKSFPEAILSIDTIQSEVARIAVDHGVSIINDISAGNIDKDMFKTVAEMDVPYVLMHMKGVPANMHQQTDYEDVVLEVLDFFIEKLGRLRELGVKDVVIDPGFGFGKGAKHNFHLLKNLHAFKILDLPILAGISRKSFIYKTLNISTEEALTGTTALHMVALDQGAKILRVHDVKEASETIKIWQALHAGS